MKTIIKAIARAFAAKPEAMHPHAHYGYYDRFSAIDSTPYQP